MKEVTEWKVGLGERGLSQRSESHSWDFTVSKL